MLQVRAAEIVPGYLAPARRLVFGTRGGHRAPGSFHPPEGASRDRPQIHAIALCAARHRKPVTV